MTIPKGLSSSDFEKALERFRLAVGDAWVLTADDDLQSYRDPYSAVWDEPEETKASGVVAPASVEQVQQVVAVANEYRVPLYAVSTGKNLGYGTTSPNYSGSVIVDLKRMNRIIEVDDRRNFCIVEPGVSYFDLYNYLVERKLRLMIDLPSNAMGGPLGNSLDHGNGYSAAPYRDHFGGHCGMEVVLANGDVVRTGMGALPGSKTWAEYKYGYGPSVDGLFAQANFGIVTKMGFWLMPMPEFFLSAQVGVPRYRDIIPMVDELNYLEDLGLMGYARIQSPMEIPRVLARPPDPELLALIAQPGGGEPDSYEAYANKQKLDFWTATMNFYGPETTVRANWEYARKRFAKIDGARFREVESATFPLSAEAIQKSRQQVSIGVPNLSAFALGARSKFTEPTDGHLWFSPVIPRSGEALIEAHRVFGEAFKALGMPSRIGPYSGPRTWFYRAFMFVLDFQCSRSDMEANQRVRKAFRYLIEVGAKHGWAEYRTAPMFQDDVAKSYSFNNHALRRFTERLKDAADPNGIFSPGRGGIWPKAVREARQ
jgi:(+)-pinoresinol hydroxylase